jgi:hypothetical protein
LWQLDAEKLCAEARARARLDDFGEPSLEPALSTLVESLEGEARLRPLGRFLIRMHLRGLLETRLRLTEVWNREAAALAESPLESPIFITGMPRSGSTFLHELLAEDPGCRAPRVWEVMFPLRGAAARDGDGARERDDERRQRKAAGCLWWYRRLAPGADAVHPLRASTPHECIAIQSYTMRSEEFVTTCRVPGYAAFLQGSDLVPMYAWQRRFLQHLQLGAPSRRWVLKSPDHVYGLEELFEVFPDAWVIQTHRHPVEVLRSLNQLNEVVQGLFVRPQAAGQSEAHEEQVLADKMERVIRFRDAHPELAGRFIDVNYAELTADPLEVARRIYEQIGMALGTTVTERLRQLAGKRSRYRAGHTRAGGAARRPEAVAEAARFAGYCSRFGLSCEPSRGA